MFVPLYLYFSDGSHKQAFFRLCVYGSKIKNGHFVGENFSNIGNFFKLDMGI